MAKAPHWSADVHILCWLDPKSLGRMRMSWGSRERCERIASGLPKESDCVLYSGFGDRVTIRAAKAATPKKTPHQARPKSRHVAVKPRKKARKHTIPVDQPIPFALAEPKDATPTTYEEEFKTADQAPGIVAGSAATEPGSAVPGDSP